MSLAPGEIGSTTAMVVVPTRREKIYCDKWVHEGTCAFTQVGCKYKHEMPTDKATQLSLGLSHGFPNWYRRANGLNPSPPTTSVPIMGGGRTTASWRRPDTPSMPSIPNPQENASFGGQYEPHGKFFELLGFILDVNTQCIRSSQLIWSDRSTNSSWWSSSFDNAIATDGLQPVHTQITGSWQWRS